MNKTQILFLFFALTCFPGYSQVVEPVILRWDSTVLVRQSHLFYANSTLVHIGEDNLGKFVSELDDSLRVLNRQTFFADHTISGAAYVNGNYMVGGTQVVVPNYSQTFAMTIVKPTGFPVANGRAMHEGQLDQCFRAISLRDSGALLLGSLKSSGTAPRVGISRFDAAGQPIWGAGYFLGKTKSWASDAIEGKSSNIYVTGHSRDSTILFSRPYLMKIGANGDSLWTRKYSEGSRGERLYRTKDDHFLIAGVNFIKNEVYQTTQERFALSKVDSLGTVIWEKSYDRFLHDSTLNRFNFADSYHTSEDGVIFLGIAKLIKGPVIGTVPYLLKVDAEGEYQWHKVLVPPNGREAIGLQVVELANGTYGVSAESSSSNPSSVYGSLILLGPDGTFTEVDPVREALGFTISPNPASDQAIINWTQEKSGETEVRVMDIQGRLMLNEQFNQPAGPAGFAISMNSWPTGTYLVEVSSNGKHGSSKLVKVGM